MRFQGFRGLHHRPIPDRIQLVIDLSSDLDYRRIPALQIVSNSPVPNVGPQIAEQQFVRTAFAMNSRSVWNIGSSSP